jgi:hypothetical protein
MASNPVPLIPTCKNPQSGVKSYAAPRARRTAVVRERQVRVVRRRKRVNRSGVVRIL